MGEGANRKPGGRTCKRTEGRWWLGVCVNRGEGLRENLNTMMDVNSGFAVCDEQRSESDSRFARLAGQEHHKCAEDFMGLDLASDRQSADFLECSQSFFRIDAKRQAYTRIFRGLVYVRAVHTSRTIVIWPLLVSFGCTP